MSEGMPPGQAGAAAEFVTETLEKITGVRPSYSATQIIVQSGTSAVIGTLIPSPPKAPVPPVPEPVPEIPSVPVPEPVPEVPESLVPEAPTPDSIPASRLPQDIAVNPNPPDALPLDRPVGLNDNQNAMVQEDIAAARAEGATDFRVNQQQVNAEGVRVGTNRPDLQYTDANGQRVYVEYDTSASDRALGHQERILANDPGATVILKTVD